ncbi:MAG: helix-turn-helix transcriptional regulator [Bacteroidales bacterium]|nr:helix-turn-helix transcriptional regulator [Bacteroidales bacterium]
MNTRLKQFLSAENITQAQFADNINVVRASVSHVLSGRNNPSYEFIRSIMVKYPKLNIEWLMFGKGKMYKEQEIQEIPDAHIPPTDLLFPEFEDEKPEIEEINEIVASSDSPNVIVNQRKVSKIIILFDDGTFQEM